MIFGNAWIPLEIKNLEELLIKNKKLLNLFS